MNEALEKLYAKRTFGIKPGLTVISKLMEELGNPQNMLRTMHIAGTNGKGSVSAMLMSALR
jgi:dihydrofolate synthase/folylpolyglutamate synthase